MSNEKRDLLCPKDLNFRPECSEYKCGAIKSWKEGWDARDEEFAALKYEVEIARERLGPSGYRILLEYAELKAKTDKLSEAFRCIQQTTKANHSLSYADFKNNMEGCGIYVDDL